MDLTVISTYRCNSQCTMCSIWQNPTLPADEVSLSDLAKLPGGFDNVNISGGEPTLRNDLLEICELLHPKAKKLEISTNGLHPERLEAAVRRFPDVKIRISLEGFKQTNDKIRGERNGYETKIRTMSSLKQLGGSDLGFAAVIQDENAQELVELYQYTRSQGLEFATSALHNAFQFHKSDNWPHDRLKVARQVEQLIVEMLKTHSIKTWFRAYLNLGLIRKILGQERLLPCTAGTDFIFIDPWADVYACNVRPDLRVGNLKNQSWDEIMNGEKMSAVRSQVAACPQNCWMVTTARTAMRNPHIPLFPKWEPFAWVLKNRLRLALGKRICFEDYIDYGNLREREKEQKSEIPRDSRIRRKIARLIPQYYEQYGPFENH